ncbi:MAG TPA: DCC1-like thiol-disulfide oxidoreductase family protein [Schlesneria sp.]|jgi:predicted DCC family thiol-disulfide oxidoreductase YuxK
MSSVAATLAASSDLVAALDNRNEEAVESILFFDGVCGLCSNAVDFVMVRDYQQAIKFAPLQGDTARSLLTAADVENLNTMILWVKGRSYRKSAAAVRVLWRLSLGWKIIGTLLWLIPLPLRNLGYTLVARNRYRFFGKKESCRLPTPAERLRFLP